MDCFEDLNEHLRKDGQKGEIGIVGGAVMCIVYNARKATRDVDAVFEPSQVIRQAAEQVAAQRGLARDWLNDGAKAYISGQFAQETVARLSHLLIWAPEARYMLAMKCISARWDTSDRDDVIFLIKHLKISSAPQVFDLIQGYYPKFLIPAKTQFFIEEVFESL
jgi:Nucleotidyltransferase of unknown function (DUF6036)